MHVHSLIESSRHLSLGKFLKYFGIDKLEVGDSSF